MQPEHDRRTRARATVLALATLAVGLAALAAVAMAGSAQERITIPAQSRGRATAACERGTTAVAGGFAAPGFSPQDDGPSAARLVSKPASRRQITTNAYNFGRQPADLVSLAYCARKRRGLEVRSKKTFIGPQDPGQAVARCRRGMKVVGGGFGTQGFSKRAGPRVLTLTSRRIGSRQWRVEGFNMGGDGSSNGARPGTLIAYAYCQKDPPKLVAASKRVEVPVAQVTSAKAKCPRGSSAYSGGFDGNIKLSADPSASAAFTSKRADRARAWKLEALNISDTSPGHVTAFAYCRR
jgi:hypothetical protein